MPQWKIPPAEYLKRLDFASLEAFEKELCLPRLEHIEHVIPLRDMRTIKHVLPISMRMLVYLIRKIKTLDGRLPFEKSIVTLESVNPQLLKVGQKFVYREKYQAILEQMPNLLREFALGTNGYGNLGAYFIFGLNDNDVYSMACYLPAIVECHGDNMVIMDGIHRHYIARQTGQTPSAILIRNISVYFPCAFKHWTDVSVIPLAQKPIALEDRYFDMCKGSFRDLKYLGIDG